MKYWPEFKAAGQNRDIAFTFEHRVVGDGVAYEVSYYRVSNPQDPTAEPDYGQFHVVLRQVDNVWKIAQDWDAGSLMVTGSGKWIFSGMPKAVF